jgi:formylglycine-generating enzyme required for sulfatase activity
MKPSRVSQEPTPRLSPGTRTALIIGGLFSFFILWTIYWVGKKATEIKHQRVETARLSSPLTGDMVWIPGGSFTMGGIGDQAASDEVPLHDVTLNGFWMDRTEVTNEQFANFVKEKHYVTTAERPVSAKTIPGLLPEFEGKTMSLCFRKPASGEEFSGSNWWWQVVIGADWRHPDGPNSDIVGKEKHPVVHVSYEDAQEYCKWAGKRLPTESEWEYAARGGLTAQPYVWGSEFNPKGQWMANTWQGKFPYEHRVDDGFESTAPVGSFPPNGYGLSDMSGNDWEWTSDWYRPDAYQMIHDSPARVARLNPHGPNDSYDPDEPGVWKKVTRGGSFMCSDNYCRGYRPSARMKTSPDTSLHNTGFRCVKDGEQ